MHELQTQELKKIQAGPDLSKSTKPSYTGLPNYSGYANK